MARVGLIAVDGRDCQVRQIKGAVLFPSLNVKEKKS